MNRLKKKWRKKLSELFVTQIKDSKILIRLHETREKHRKKFFQFLMVLRKHIFNRNFSFF